MIFNIKHKSPIPVNPYNQNHSPSIAFDNPAYDINPSTNTDSTSNSNNVEDITNNRGYIYQDVLGAPVEYENVEPPSTYYPDGEYLDILERRPESETDL